jgi:foldase protein PrsA
MLKKISIVGVLVSLFAVAALFAAEDAKLETVVASVDGEAVTKDDLYLSMIQSYPNQANETLNRLVNNILIKNDAAKKKISVSDKEIQDKVKELGLNGELAPAVRSAIISSLLLEKILTKEKNLSVNDEEVKTFYDQNKDKLGEPEQIRLRQIFMKSENQINDILVALKAGADFSKMAQAKSEDEQSRQKGGDIGYFSKGMLLPEIEKVVFSLKAGETSPVITTSAGYILLKVEERKEAKQPKFDSATRQNLKKLILGNKIQKETQPYLDDLRKKAVIK